MAKCKWIFFDVGSTLVDETEAYNHRIRDMIENTDISFEAFDAMRISLAKQGYDGNAQAIKHFGLKKTPWHSEDEVLYGDAERTLRCLREKGYRLGIIANQPPGTQARLAKRGILQYFAVVIASSEAGAAKPDRAIFEKAFEAAGCAPNESVMVGDRLDNDMIPAKAAGMQTVWLRTGLSRYQSAALGKGYADYQIETLSELLNIL